MGNKLKNLIIIMLSLLSISFAFGSSYFTFDTTGYLNKVSDIRNPSGTVLNLSGGLSYEGVNVCLVDGSSGDISLAGNKILNYVGGLNLSQPTIIVAQDGSGHFNGYDETPINQAINYLNSIGGGKITIKCGNYNTEAIVLQSNIILEGEGFCTTINNTGLGNTISTTNSQNIVIRNLKINHNHITAQHSLRFENVDNVMIENIMSIDAGHHNLWFTNATNLIVKDNIVNGAGKDEVNSGVGIIVLGTEKGKVIISNNFVEDTGYHGIQGHHNDAELIITGNHIQDVGNVNSAGDLIQVQSNGEKVIISNNIGIDSNNNGLEIDNSTDITIANNQVYNIYDGIRLISVNRTTISGNLIQNTTRAGMYISSNSQNIVINGNNLNTILGDGVWISNVKYASIFGNVMAGLGGSNSGVMVEGSTSSHISAIGNIISTPKYAVRFATAGQNWLNAIGNIAQVNVNYITNITDVSGGSRVNITANIVDDN
jgi:parallel beta-helix repeat protein